MKKPLSELAERARTEPAARAIAVWSEILVLDAVNAEALYSRACCFAETGEAEAALADMKRLCLVSSTLATRLESELELGAGPYCDIGFDLLETGKLEDAQRAFQIAKCYSPRFTDAHIGLGRVYMEMGLFEKCEESFQAALNCESDNAFALMGLGDLELGRGNPECAVRWYTAVLEEMDEAYCYQQRADAYAALGMMTEAEADRMKASTIVDDGAGDSSLEV